jgi:hypothetical protein
MLQKTAWELSSDWWWVGTYEAVLKNKAYEDATALRNSKNQDVVMLRRVDGLVTRVRYVSPDTVMVLKPIKHV